MRSWKTILSEQLSDDAERLSVEDATILYEEADINDLIEDFNYQPTTTVEKGIKEFVKWYKSYYRV